jgi:hypothetical protein
MEMLALFLSNKLLSLDCNRNAAEKFLGPESNIGGSYGGIFPFPDGDDDDDDADDDDDDNDNDNDNDNDDDDDDDDVHIDDNDDDCDGGTKESSLSSSKP